MRSSIRILECADVPAIEAHLLRLEPADRSLRFTAGVVTDDAIRRYVASIRFGADAVLGIVTQHDVVALAHGCVYRVGSATHVEAAFSVDRALRGQGCGKLLMTAVHEIAASIGAESIVAMCVARNLPMRRIFAGAGMTMTREEDEVHACCRLASVPETTRGQEKIAA